MDGVLFTIPDWLDYADFNNYPSEENPTTNADFIDYANNQNILLGALVAAVLWQPNTNFIAGKIIISPNMPEGMEAVALTSGATGASEPAWEIDTEEYQDSGVKWKLRYKHWSKSVEEIADLTTGATNRLPNKAYTVGNVVYTDSNLSVALKCTQAGTTSNTELDISTRAVGESVEDGSVVWEVVPRFLPAETINEIANELIEELFVGFIGTYAGNTPPTGWLSCSGASLNPQTYTRLFGRIGTIYGGDGSTTFNLPNLNNGSFLEGSTTAGTVKSAGLPDHRHTVTTYSEYSDGPITGETKTWRKTKSTTTGLASASNSIYGKSTTVQPKSVTVKYCIKY